MSDEMQKRLDSIVEDDIRKGYRVKDVPAELVQALEALRAMDPATPVFRKVRFTKLTPRKRRLINEAVVRRYHIDLKNPDILSNEQLKKLNIERGEWSVALEERLQTLQDQTNTLMRDLYLDGIDRRDEWVRALANEAEKVRREIDEARDGENRRVLTAEQKAEAHRRFTRWFDFIPEVQAEYDTKYAADQGLPKYSVDRDQAWMFDNAPSTEFVDAINEIEDIRDKLQRYVKLLDLRRELLELQVKQSKVFAESVEQRRDVCEEMARMYYCTETVDEKDVGMGAVTKTFDQVWDLPDDVVQWLQIELYFFLNGIPDEARDFLQQWGLFTVAPRSNGSLQPSDESPVEPSSKTDTPPLTETVVGSLEPSVPTSSAT